MFIGKKPTDAPLTSSDVADGIITSAKIADGTIVNADVNASAAIVGSKLSGAGISVADNWRLTASFTSNADITSNLERVDTSGQGTLGSTMSESSGVFTFPSTGIWQVTFFLCGQSSSSGDNVVGHIKATTNNSSYANMAYGAFGTGDDRVHVSPIVSFIDVTDTANVKVKFTVSSVASGSELYGSSTDNNTHFTFIRLGDT